VLFDWECLPRSNLLGAKASIESYKVCFLVEKIVESEKTVLDALSTLTEKLAVLEKKVELYGGDVDKVHVKVDLVMQSISLV
jgi:hypothetical protein